MRAEVRGDECVLTLSSFELVVLISALTSLESFVSDAAFDDYVGVDREGYHELASALSAVAQQMPVGEFKQPSAPVTFPIRVDQEMYRLIYRTAALRGTDPAAALRHLVEDARDRD